MKRSKPSYAQTRKLRRILRPHSISSLQYTSLEPRQLLAGDLTPAGNFVAPAIENVFSYDAVTVEDLIGRTEHRPFVTGHLIVAMEIDDPQWRPHLAPDQLNWSGIVGVEGTTAFRTLLSTGFSETSSVSLVHLDLGKDADLFAAMRHLDTLENVLWSSPNFYQNESPLDFIPNDPSYASQYHHPLMQSDDAWDTTLGDPSIIIAVTDDGVDLDHPDLAQNIFVNTGEIPNDSIDNDGNGYIDDVTGWDFATVNNDPNPQGIDDNHGTHVSGIAAADTNNGIGVAGTAGAATIMPLQFYNYNNTLWTAAVINETFSYAVDNGAHIVSTSYNIDSWVGDPVFTAGLQYIHDNGRIHFNSAGNAGSLNPARQAFENTILVANSTTTDALDSSSNYGFGIDITSPGTDILSTVQSGYASFTGTSMATPDAAGVAALIWSAHPTWTRDQVVAQLYATSDDIDAANPNKIGLVGAGRTNSFGGVATTIAAPQVEEVIGLPFATTTVSDLTIDGFTLSFSHFMDPASVLNTNNYELRSAGPDEIFDTGDDVILAMTFNSQYLVGTNDLDFNITSGALDYGEYRLTLTSGGLQDPFGTDLDGNYDNVAGTDYVHSFSIAPPPPTKIDPAGSLQYAMSFNAILDTSQSIGVYEVPLDAGQTISIIVFTPNLSPNIDVFDPGGSLIGSATGSGFNNFLELVPVATAGNYSIQIASNTGSAGPYQMQVMLNTGLEQESIDGTSNDDMNLAEDLDSSSVLLGSGAADRLAAIGILPSGGGTTIYSDDFESTTLGPAWSTYSSDSLNGRVQVTGDYGEAAGDWALTMDQTNDGVFNLNEAIWTVDLAGLFSPSLVFFHTNYNDEVDNLPQSFQGHVNGDGIAISDDGTNWYTIWDSFLTGSGTWVESEIDLASAAAAAGMTLNSTFQIKFQQYDNFDIDFDGLGFDELQIVAPDLTADWYKFTLEDGQQATISATRYQDHGLIDIELFNAAGTLLATGIPADNVGNYVSQYFDTTSNAIPDEYFIKVVGSIGDYSVVVTRGAEFDLEPNDIVDLEIQDITNVDSVLGYTASFELVNAEPDFFPTNTIVNTAFPDVILSNIVTDGDVFVSEAPFSTPTGIRVFSAAINAPEGWQEGVNELRADFANLQLFVSIDVGSDDSSDAAFLRAYNSAGTLISQIVSSGIPSGGSQTISIGRPTADIAYVIAAGLGTDITPLDNLVYSAAGTADVYGIDVVAGEPINYTAYLPGDGPHLFNNGLNGVSGSLLNLELLDPNGAIVATGSTSIVHSAALTGTYQLVVNSIDGAGEYFLERVTGGISPDILLDGPAAAITEGDSGTVNATFEITLSAAAAANVTVDYATNNAFAANPATPGVDYVDTVGTATFLPGQTSFFVDVPVNGDEYLEAIEGFRLELSNESANAVLVDSFFDVTIDNDDVFANDVIVDFGTDTSPVLGIGVGFRLEDYTPAIGAGWSSTVDLTSAEKAVGNDLARDLAQMRSGTFSVDVPNDTYDVQIYYGVVRRRDPFRITFESDPQVTEFLTFGTNVSRIYTTTVTDGQLNMAFTGTPGLDPFARIAGFKINPVVAKAGDLGGKDIKGDLYVPQMKMAHTNPIMDSGTKVAAEVIKGSELAGSVVTTESNLDSFFDTYSEDETKSDSAVESLDSVIDELFV